VPTETAITTEDVLVVDSSAIVETLVATDPEPRLRARLAADGELHAPHLIDLEVLDVLRRFVRRGKLSPQRADDARAEYRELAITRYPHHGLVDQIWQLRHNLTAYDAVYVALAAALDAPLITCDGRLGAAANERARVEVFAPGPFRETRKN
jgi:predicted nucleic acid-binding protein